MKLRLLPLLAVCGLGACGGKKGVEPPAELVSFEPTLNVHEVWKHKVGRGTERLRLGLVPASDGMRIFAGSHDGTAVALGLEDGEVLWSTETEAPLSGGPAVGNGMVVFGTSDGQLVVLDAETGAVRWQRLVGSEILSAPAIADNFIAYQGVDGRLVAVSAGDGEEAWSVLQTMPALTLRGTSTPLAIDDTIVAGFDNGRVGAYAVDTGANRWQSDRQLSSPGGRSEIDRLVDTGIDLQLFGNAVYAVNFHGEAASIDLRTGVMLWERDVSSYAGLGVDSDRVYVTDAVGAVIALNRQNGQNEVWHQDALRLRDVTAPTRYRETVVVGDFEGYVHWLNAEDGSFMARERAASSRITARPLAVGPRVYVQSEDGTVAAFEVVDDSA